MYILTRKLFRKDSALLLAEALAVKLGEEVKITINSEKILNSRFIRYGNSDPVAVPDTKYNSSEFIRLVASKWKFCKLLKEHGFYCPDFIYDRFPTAAEYPVIVRSTLTSSGGRGITVCKNENDLRACWATGYFWTKFVKTTLEYRVHVLGGEVKKLFVKEHEDGNREELPIRNMHKGYHFALRDISDYPGITKVINKLNTVLTGKFYTLDIGWDNVNKKYFIFEANSASGLNHKTADIYANYLSQELSR